MASFEDALVNAYIGATLFCTILVEFDRNDKKLLNYTGRNQRTGKNERPKTNEL